MYIYIYTHVCVHVCTRLSSQRAAVTTMMKTVLQQFMQWVLGEQVPGTGSYAGFLSAGRPKPQNGADIVGSAEAVVQDPMASLDSHSFGLQVG